MANAGERATQKGKIACLACGTTQNVEKGAVLKPCPRCKAITFRYE